MIKGTADVRGGLVNVHSLVLHDLVRVSRAVNVAAADLVSPAGVDRGLSVDLPDRIPRERQALHVRLAQIVRDRLVVLFVGPEHDGVTGAGRSQHHVRAHAGLTHEFELGPEQRPPVVAVCADPHLGRGNIVPAQVEQLVPDQSLRFLQVVPGHDHVEGQLARVVDGHVKVAGDVVVGLRLRKHKGEHAQLQLERAQDGALRRERERARMDTRDRIPGNANRDPELLPSALRELHRKQARRVAYGRRCVVERLLSCGRRGRDPDVVRAVGVVVAQVVVLRAVVDLDQALVVEQQLGHVRLLVRIAEVVVPGIPALVPARDHFQVDV